MNASAIKRNTEIHNMKESQNKYAEKAHRKKRHCIISFTKIPENAN